MPALFLLVIRNALRNRRRTLLTVTSVAISIFLLVSLQTLLTEIRGDTLLTKQAERRLLTRNALFLSEATILAVFGGILGGVMALPLNGIGTGTTNWFTFSEMNFAFAVTPQLMAQGVVFAVAMGIAGGLLPAFRASRLSRRLRCARSERHAVIAASRYWI